MVDVYLSVVPLSAVAPEAARLVDAQLIAAAVVAAGGALVHVHAPLLAAHLVAGVARAHRPPVAAGNALLCLAPGKLLATLG